MPINKLSEDDLMNYITKVKVFRLKQELTVLLLISTMETVDALSKKMTQDKETIAEQHNFIQEIFDEY